MRLYLPHISRIFSAKTRSWIGNVCLWVLLLALISLNVSLWITKPLAYSDKLIDVFNHPLSWDTHVTLARALWQNGPKNLGLRELILAAELFPTEGAVTNTQVLGAVASPKDMLLAWQNEPTRQKQYEDYWQNILTSHPDYRDAYIQLAALSYREGNLTQAHAYLVKAQILDPNNATVNRLVNFTSKFLE